MRKYWGKITLSALLIFIVGYGIVSAGRRVKDSIHTSKDITIPLGSFIAFKLDGHRVGSIRQIRFRRSEPRVLAGIDVRVRISDTAAFAKLRNCRLSVNDAERFDERTTFVCLTEADSGYQQFGEVTAYMSDPDREDPTMVLPLLLSDAAIAQFRNDATGGPGEMRLDLGDSIAAEVHKRARVLEQRYEDSMEADRLDKRSEQYKARADSIRLRQKSSGTPPAPSTTVPPSNPKPL
jgi:hypothetical protein